MTIKRPSNDENLTTNNNLENYKNYITTTPTEPEPKKTLGEVYTEVYGTLFMTGQMSKFFMDIRNKGYDESFCTELLLEASECCGGGRPPIRYLQPIRDRWIREGIKSREQAKAAKTGQQDGSDDFSVQSQVEGTSNGGQAGSTVETVFDDLEYKKKLEQLRAKRGVEV
ncbi:hypothetical protein D3C75_769320 [compost metagenome]